MRAVASLYALRGRCGSLGLAFALAGLLVLCVLAAVGIEPVVLFVVLGSDMVIARNLCANSSDIYKHC